MLKLTALSEEGLCPCYAALAWKGRGHAAALWVKKIKSPEKGDFEDVCSDKAFEDQDR